jgi:hypothetical protein
MARFTSPRLGKPRVRYTHSVTRCPYFPFPFTCMGTGASVSGLPYVEHHKTKQTGGRLRPSPLGVPDWGRGKLPTSIIASPMGTYTAFTEVGEDGGYGRPGYATGGERSTAAILHKWVVSKRYRLRLQCIREYCFHSAVSSTCTQRSSNEEDS